MCPACFAPKYKKYMVYPEEFHDTLTSAEKTTPSCKETLLIYLFSSLLLVTLGSIVQHLDLLRGLVITELAFVAGPVLLFTLATRYRLTETFYLSPIRLKTLLITMLTTGAAFVLVGIVATCQEMVFPRSQDYQEIWGAILMQFHQIPLIVTLALVALLPGICEELLFRGFLLHGLRKNLPDGFAIVLVGCLFGAFHLDPYRFLPVTLLGILFGYMVVKTGSIFTGMVAHGTNNAIAMLISYAVFAAGEQGVSLPQAQTTTELLTPDALVTLIPSASIALLVFVLGLRALPRMPLNDAPKVNINANDALFFERGEIRPDETLDEDDL